ncbi:MAG TPA: DUF4440 domain-containing protein [Steroidobacteraceae bacterium]|nr:DUF4440 domain-containing protein [Steroidobacteraceae bacterium]
MMKEPLLAGLLGLAGLLSSPGIGATQQSDRRAVAMLDTQFQAAVKRNDADAIARILHDDMVLVLGDGSVSSRADTYRRRLAILLRAGLLAPAARADLTMRIPSTPGA